jgi:hypothetical protein
MDTIWEFNTARFRVTCEVEDEQEPDLSWADAETLDKIDRGVYVNVSFAVKVYLDGRKVSADYLGNSVYENVRDFVHEHRSPDPEQRNTLALRAQNKVICTYFSGMIREAIGEARATLLGEREIYIREA